MSRPEKTRARSPSVRVLPSHQRQPICRVSRPILPRIKPFSRSGFDFAKSHGTQKLNGIHNRLCQFTPLRCWDECQRIASVLSDCSALANRRSTRATGCECFSTASNSNCVRELHTCQPGKADITFGGAPGGKGAEA